MSADFAKWFDASVKPTHFRWLSGEPQPLRQIHAVDGDIIIWIGTHDDRHSGTIIRGSFTVIKIHGTDVTVPIEWCGEVDDQSSF